MLFRGYILALLVSAPVLAHAALPAPCTLDERETGEHPAAAPYRQGLCLLRQGKAQEALDAFFESEILEAPVREWVRYRVGQAHALSGQHAIAEHIFSELLLHAPSPLAEHAIIAHAEVSFAEGEWEAAVERLSFVIREFPEHPDRSVHRLHHALATVQTGETVKGIDLLASLVRDWGHTHAGLEAQLELNAFQKLGSYPNPLTFEQRLSHIAYLRGERRWKEAEQWVMHSLLPVQAGALSSPERRQLQMELGAIQFGAEEFDRALSTYQTLWEEERTDEIGRQIARCLQRLGRIAEAKDFHQLRVSLGASRQAVISDLQALLWTEGEYGELMEQSGTRLPLKEQHWRDAWLYFRTGKLEQAVARFERHAQLYSGDEPKATYWMAKALMESGQRERGLAVLEELVRKDDGFGYYGLQAMNRLYDAGRIPTAFFRYAPSAWPRVNKTAAKIHWWPGYSMLPHSLATLGWKKIRNQLRGMLPSSVALHRVLEKVFFLAAAGETEAAREVSRTVVASALAIHRGTAVDKLDQNGPDVAFDNRPKDQRAGVWGSPIGARVGTGKGGLPAEEYRAVLTGLTETVTPEILELLLQLHATLAGEWNLLSQFGRARIPYRKNPSEDLRGAFEDAFPPVYEMELSNKGLQPDLVRALMQVESRFNPLAISRSDARGLMQVLPRTGRLIARKRGYDEFGKTLLLEPSVALDFGTWYLTELVRKFKGQEVLAVCSYNTGPFNVDFWLSRKGDLPFDVFLEEVPWKQPRAYVKKVLANLQVYMWIRSGSNALYVSNGMDAKTLDNIDF